MYQILVHIKNNLFDVHIVLSMSFGHCATAAGAGFDGVRVVTILSSR